MLGFAWITCKYNPFSYKKKEKSIILRLSDYCLYFNLPYSEFPSFHHGSRYQYHEEHLQFSRTGEFKNKDNLDFELNFKKYKIPFL